jgi:hypothetical protein
MLLCFSTAIQIPAWTGIVFFKTIPQTVIKNKNFEVVFAIKLEERNELRMSLCAKVFLRKIDYFQDLWVFNYPLICTIFSYSV